MQKIEFKVKLFRAAGMQRGKHLHNQGAAAAKALPARFKSGVWNTQKMLSKRTYTSPISIWVRYLDASK